MPSSPSGMSHRRTHNANIILRVRHQNASHFKSSKPLVPTFDGISIGTASITSFQCNHDPLVSSEHGTLDCTRKLGIWVYMDHSEHGTIWNQHKRLHHQAIVVQHGDRLLLGNTEIELLMDDMVQKTSSNQLMDDQPERKRSSIPPIQTSGDAFHALQRADVTPEYIDSPIPSAKIQPRRKRHSTSSPLLQQYQQPPLPSSPRTEPPPHSATPLLHSRMHQTVVTPSPPSTPAPSVSTHQTNFPHHRRLRSEGDEFNGLNTAIVSQPPLEYSSSPVTTAPIARPAPVSIPSPSPSPSPLLAAASRLPTMAIPQLQLSPRTLHTYDTTTTAMPQPMKSRRDDLRIQVSKKMAGCVGRGRPTKLHAPSSPTPLHVKTTAPTATTKSSNNQLDFSPPASPVAHKDILRQKQSLLNILKHKYKEEQSLKEQQQEWLRQQQPPSPSTYQDQQDDEDKMLELPEKAPVLLRTASLGPYHHPSPRLTAAVLASRARKHSIEGKHLQPTQVHVPAAFQRSDVFSSVASSASTEIANHRRMNRSLSVSSSKAASSGDLSDFMLNYEEDPEFDDITSFTTHALYSSDELKRSSGDDPMLLRSSSTSESMRRARPEDDDDRMDRNQIVGSPVLSFAPTPYQADRHQSRRTNRLTQSEHFKSRPLDA